MTIDTFNKPKIYIQNEQSSPHRSSHETFDFYLGNLKKESSN